ncbi:MAG: RNA 2',3'-cyclic phosphodiesterase [Candidatus Dactylopiibacterium sp.]|nr:RNA 2',3'-cyclic phosphodiesterase [Candidatus Dactylopiibacterium sp.]
MEAPAPEIRRAFFALWLPPVCAGSLLAQARPWGGRPMHAADLHLTLAFLGDLAPAACLRLQALAGGLALPPCELAFTALDYWAHNRVLWARLADWPAPMAEFTRQLHDALRQAGFRLDPRPFQPHVTLARAAPAPHAPLPPVADVPAWRVEGWRLAASTRAQRPGAPRYAPVARWP